MSAQREQNSFTTFKPPSMEGLKPHLDIGAIDITIPPVKQSFWRRFIALMDVSLLKDRGYLNILFGLSIFYVAEMNFKMITPFFFASLGKLLFFLIHFNSFLDDSIFSYYFYSFFFRLQ